MPGYRVALAVATIAVACSAAAPDPVTAAPLAPAQPHREAADFAGEAASSDARRVADWVVASNDGRGLPFVIVDKIAAKLFAFDRAGVLLGASPALLGLARGDVSPPGIGDRPLSSIAPAERITPAGRFLASQGHDLGAKDIVWVDYAAAISLHRVVTNNPAEARLRRLATVTPLDNRISYGCINVPAAFYDRVIHPIFSATDGIVYILPETQPVTETFFHTVSHERPHPAEAISPS